MDNILINFTSDPAGLKPGIDALDQLIAKNKELAIQVKRVADAMEGRDAEVSDTSKAAKKDVEGLTAAVSNLGKSAAGGALVTTLRNITLEMGKLASIKASNVPFVDNLANRLKFLETITKKTSVSVGKDLPDALEKIKTKTPQATQALTNFGRVVQDAPFGIIGIANNIDPLVESFGRLRTETGSTKGALQAMLGSLAGPAGIGIAISAVTSLIIAFGDEIADAFSKYFPSAERAIELQKQFNDTLREANDELVGLSKSYASLYLQRATDAQRALSLAQAQGKSEAEIFVLKQQANTAERLQQVNRLATLGLDEKSVQLNEANLQLMNEQLLSKLSLSNAQKELTDDQKKEIDLLKARIGALKGITDEGRSLVDGIKQSNAERAEEEAAEAKRTLEAGIRSATALTEARVSLAKKGSILERDAQIAAIRQRVAAEKQLNINLTPGERAKLEADAQKEIQDVHFNFQKRALQDAKTGIDAQVLHAKEGSKEEFDLKIQSLELARQIELKDQELTANKKREINERYHKQALEMSRAFNQKQAENAVNTEVANTQRQIAELAFSNTEASNAELVALKKKLIDDQAKLEALSVTYSEKNEELRLAKIKVIYARALAEKEDLERKKISAEISAEFDPKEQDISNQLDQISQISGAVSNNAFVVMALAKTTFQYRKSLRELEEAEDLKRLQNKDLTEVEYAARRKAREQQQTKDSIDLSIQKAKLREQIEQKLAEYINRTEDLIFNNAQVNIQKDQELNQELFDKKLISEKEFNDRKDQLNKQAAELQKRKALFDIGVELAKSLFALKSQFAILAANPITSPLALNALAQIGFVVGQAAASTALVVKNKYRYGGLIEGPGTGTSDSVPILASRGEFVTRYEQTAKHRQALEAINNDRFPEYLRMIELPKLIQYQLPEMPAGMERMIETRSAGASIDHDRLSKLVAENVSKGMSSHPIFKFSIDKDGMNTSIMRGLDEITIKNRKLNS